MLSFGRKCCSPLNRWVDRDGFVLFCFCCLVCFCFCFCFVVLFCFVFFIDLKHFIWFPLWNTRVEWWLRYSYFNKNVTNRKSLTLKWPRYFYSRWCPRGGVPWNPPEKTTFPPESCNEICTIYVRVIKNHNSATKKNKNVVLFQNGGQITDFYFASFRFWPNF